MLRDILQTEDEQKEKEELCLGVRVKEHSHRKVKYEAE